MPKPDFSKLTQRLLDEDLRSPAPYLPPVPEAGQVGAMGPVSPGRLSFERQAAAPLDPLGLMRRGDILPGPQQALAAADVAEARSMREGLGEDAPWYAGPLLRGAEGLSALGMLPAIGGMTAAPRRAMVNLAQELFKRRGTGGTLDVATGTDVPSGFMVGRGEASGTELVLPPGAGPKETADWLQRIAYDVDQPGTNIGIWGSPETGKTYVDLPERIRGPQLTRFHEGRRKLAERGEEAGFDIETGRTVPTTPGVMIPGATHRAQTPLTELDVTMAGTNRGLRGAERARSAAPYFAPPKGYLGVPGVYRGEPGLGREFHTADLFGIYDPSQQPEVAKALNRQLDEAMKELGTRDRNTRATLMEQALIDMGYTGMVQPRSGVVSVFENVPLQYGGRLQGPYLGPQYGMLAGLEGGPRLEEIPSSALRGQRFQRQQAVQQQMFGEPAAEPAFKARPVRAKRRKQTVADPERMAFPDIYLPEQQIVDRARALWTPESPHLRGVFGVGRQDVLEGFREAERRGGGYRHGTPVRPGPAEYVSRITTPENTLRMKNILALSSEDPDLAASYGWYWTDPMLQDYLRIHGPDRGLQEYLRLHQAGAALSPRTEVPKETQRASIFDIQRRQGDPSAFLARQLPPGAGHFAAAAHEPALRRMLSQGRFATTDPLQAAKSDPYFGARTGQNFDTAVIDAHMAAQSGLVDVRPSLKTGPEGSVRGYEGHLFNPWFGRRVAHPLGKRAVGSQAQLWNVMGPTTGVESDLGAPLLETFANLAAYKGLQTGQTPREAWEAFVRGEHGLYEPGYTDWAKELYRR